MPAGRATCNVVPAPEIYASKANDGCLVQDMEGARKLLDEAGWMPGSDGIRQKDGVRLSILYQTSTNAVRQDFQALIKQWWNEIGIEVELRNINASVFFGGDPGNPDTFQKFQADIQMYTSSSDSPDPQNYLGNWRCGREPRPETQWQGTNIVRHCNAEYDRLMDRMAATGDLSERAELARAMNDLLVQNYVLIPLVARGVCIRLFHFSRRSESQCLGHRDQQHSGLVSQQIVYSEGRPDRRPCPDLDVNGPRSPCSRAKEQNSAPFRERVGCSPTGVAVDPSWSQVID